MKINYCERDGLFFYESERGHGSFLIGGWMTFAALERLAKIWRGAGRKCFA
jgi:hypothetical protein